MKATRVKIKYIQLDNGVILHKRYLKTGGLCWVDNNQNIWKVKKLVAESTGRKFER